MKLLNRIAIWTVAFLLYLPSHAQETCVTASRTPYEWPGHNNWFFTQHLYAGTILNFQTGVFTTVGDAFKPFQAYEGVSGASDDQGNLIFFTNGRQVLNAALTQTYAGLLTGNENGSTSNKGSASQGVITVRHPLMPFDYYIFTVDDALSNTAGLNYAVMDENGNPKGGTTRLGNFRTTEGITATFHANGVDIWIAVQESGSNRVHAYLLTCSGIDLVNSPVISTGVENCTANEERGGVSFNWDGTKFVSAHPAAPGNKIIEFDFDKKTGQMTNPIGSAGGNKFPYDVTYSPDNSRILFSDNVGSVYSMAAPNGVPALVAGGGSGHSAIEIGADGNLYRASLGGPNLTRLTGDLNGGGALAATNNLTNTTSRGLPTMYIPPAEEPDIQEVGPFCNTDPIEDLHTNWVCSGLSAEDTLYNRNEYTGPGITNADRGFFDPGVAGPGIHEIIFTYCDVNDTIWIEVTDCQTCEVELQDVTPELCVGEQLLLDTMVLENSADGVWTIDSVPSSVSVDATLTEGADTIFDASNLATKPGTYKLMFTVTDGGDECKDSIYVVVHALPVVDLGDDVEICFEDPAVDFDAGNVTATYAWSSGESTQVISKDVAGEYIVEIVDTNGCEGTDTVVLTVNALPVVDLGDDVEICFGDPAVDFDAGNATATYAWSSGENTQVISKDVAGEYIVEIVDTNGCEGTDTVVLAVNALPVVDLGDDVEICFGDPAVDFDAGNATATYGWSSGENTQVISKDVAGEYIVEIVDTNGCEGTDTVVLTVNALPVVDLGDDVEICFGDPAVDFDAGNATATYAWSSGENTQVISKDVAGEYIVEIVDTNGCEGTDTVVLTVNALPVVDLGDDVEICFGDPAVDFDAGNITATYAWSSGENTQVISKDVAGEYIVEIVDTNGCEGTDTVVLTVNALPVVDLGDDVEICFGDPAVDFDAGNATATYAWSSGENTQVISKDVAGEYIVEIVDTNGCEGTDTVVLTVNALPVVDLGDDVEICFGDPAVDFDAGNVTATYAWSSGENTQVISKDVAGEYIVEIVDTNGCEGTDTVVLTVNALPVVDLGDDVEICFGDPAVDFDAGNVTATYAWSSGENTQVISKDVAGEYIVEIVDTNGCEGTDTVVLTVNALPVVDLGDDVEICEIDPAVTIDAANPTAMYLWNNGETTRTIDVHDEAEYSVVVTDENGCIEKDTFFLKVNNMPTVAIGDDVICFGDDAVTFDAGAGFATYTWSNGELTQSISTNIAGEYIVNFVDAQGCAGADTLVLTVNALPTPDLGDDQTICADAAAVIFDAGNYASYKWGTGEVSNSIATNTAGSYIVEVTDLNGCKGSDTVDLVVIPLPTPDVILDVSMCPGMNSTFDASVYDNGNGPFTFAWHDGSATAKYIANAAESIWVDVTDSYGCTARDYAEVTVLNNLTVSIIGAPTIEICIGENVDLIPNYKAIDGYNFLWSTGEATESINVTESNSYDVHVDNGAGCEGDATIDVIVHPLPVVDPSAATICDGEAALIGTDQGAAYTYEWDTGEKTATILVGDAGTYTQTVTHATQGCVNSTTVDVTVNSNPVPDLGDDIEVCEGTPVILSDKSGEAGLTYVWNTGENTATISPVTAGRYTLNVTTAAGCEGEDDVNVSFLSIPTVDLGDDINLCEGETSSVDAGNAGLDIVWNTGQTTTGFEVSATNQHIVTVSNGLCSATDTIQVNVVPLPVSEIDHSLSNQLYCFESLERGIDVSAGSSNAYTYTWGTGENTAEIAVTAPGTYIVNISVGNCEITDKITFEEYCPSVIFVPNTFTPDGDGLNDSFNARGDNIENYHMYIFNRWGELIFESKSMYNDWDGTYKGNLVQIDTYVYKIYYTLNDPSGHPIAKQQVGHVNVLR